MNIQEDKWVNIIGVKNLPATVVQDKMPAEPHIVYS